MYLGEFICKIDKKNRIFIPSSFRKKLNEIVLTYIDEDTLVIKSSEDWTPNGILESEKVPNNQLQKYTHYIELNSITIKVDSQGRIVIPSNIINKISFKEECMIIGRMDKILIINKTKYLEESNRINEEWKSFLESEEGRNFKRTLIFKKK